MRPFTTPGTCVSRGRGLRNGDVSPPAGGNAYAEQGSSFKDLGNRAQGLEWRKTFSEEQPEPIRESLLAALNAQGSAIFNEFARRLRESPLVMRAWNRYLQKQITDHVEAWAAKFGVPRDRWLAPSHGIQFFRADSEVAAPKPQNISQRAELYNFFDQLPLEDLLELRVPLEWVLKVTRRGDA